MSIRIITEPSVYLVGRQAVDKTALATFLESIGAADWTTDTTVAGERLAEVSGRNCYQSFARPRPGGNAAYLRHLLEVGHGSVLEHAVYSLIITGISRSLSHEFVRHRHLSYSQLSQRYVDESDVAFVVPPAILAKGPSDIRYQMVLEHCADSLDRYSKLTNWLSIQEISGIENATVDQKTAIRKRAREAARSVLPNCTETKLFVTGNIRAWRGMLDQRATEGADAEFRRLAVAILRTLQTESPNLFGDYTITACPGGGEIASTPYSKV